MGQLWMRVCFIHPVEGLYRRKRPASLSKREFYSREISNVSCNISFPLGLQPAGPLCRSALPASIISWINSSQSINRHIQTHTESIGAISLENPNALLFQKHEANRSLQNACMISPDFSLCKWYSLETCYHHYMDKPRLVNHMIRGKRHN